MRKRGQDLAEAGAANIYAPLPSVSPLPRHASAAVACATPLPRSTRRWPGFRSKTKHLLLLERSLQQWKTLSGPHTVNFDMMCYDGHLNAQAIPSDSNVLISLSGSQTLCCHGAFLYQPPRFPTQPSWITPHPVPPSWIAHNPRWRPQGTGDPRWRHRKMKLLGTSHAAPVSSQLRPDQEPQVKVDVVGARWNCILHRSQWPTRNG